jgi:hypothetical protein
MNFPTHGLHSTCPQGTARTALEPFERALRQAGQVRIRALELVEVEASSVKFMGVRVFRESGCGEDSVEEGQRGFSLLVAG